MKILRMMLRNGLAHQNYDDDVDRPFLKGMNKKKLVFSKMTL